MTTTSKGQKDKPYVNPRLVPRATAASAARAARNATNRNLMVPATIRQSPTRNLPSSPKLQVKSSQRIQKCDSKTDVKVNNDIDNESSDNVMMPAMESVNNVADTTIKIIEEMPDEQPIKDEAAKGIHMPECETNETSFIDTVHSEGDHQKQNELELTSEDPKSRPETPAAMPRSRPQTPKSVRSSRPQTPRVPSRPTTPAYPILRQGTPISRPITPQSTCHSLPKTPSISVPPSSRVMTPSSPSRSFREADDIKSTFLQKQKQFHHLKKELDLKQQVVLEAFDSLRELREQMAREGLLGSGEAQLQELVVLNVADWSAEEISQLCHDATASLVTEGALEVITKTLLSDECDLAEMDAKVLNVPAHFADLCLQAFTARQEVIDWVKELLEKDENGSGECLERIARYNAHGLELCESLRELKSRADDAVDSISRLSKRALQERSTLMNIGKSLVHEIARLRQDVQIHSETIKELQEYRNEMDRNELVEELRRELEEERAMRVTGKEKLSSTEAQLRQSRIRITKMDRQLREAEASIASLTGTVKTLEDQSRQREVQLEARARKLKENLKTGEITSNQLAQHRDVLQNEIHELKQQIESMTAQHKTTINELNSKLKETKTMLQQQCQITQKESEQKKAVEAALFKARSDIEALNAKVNELEMNKPNPDLPTEREMELWAELQSTKDTLRMTEDEVTACKREKVRFLETLTKITDSDNKMSMQQKLAAELLSKEEILGKMQLQIRELTKNIKLNEQKVTQYEQYVRDLQMHNRTMADGQETTNGINCQDLQQEIMNLKMSLLEAVHRNEQLSEQLMQKEQHIEQQDKTSRAQARVIKVREELINMLKNKETEQSRELAALQKDLEHRMMIVDEVNKQIATKADEIQELFSTLENKQQQIHRLEKIVLALEEQQRRAQAQRTRHEEKIAALEHELAANGNRKERKFLFF